MQRVDIIVILRVERLLILLVLGVEFFGELSAMESATGDPPDADAQCQFGPTEGAEGQKEVRSNSGE